MCFELLNCSKKLFEVLSLNIFYQRLFVIVMDEKSLETAFSHMFKQIWPAKLLGTNLDKKRRMGGKGKKSVVVVFVRQ